MQRVKRSTAVAVLPADPGGGTPGYFPQPNPGGGVPAAVPGYEWYNNIQEEVIAPILAAGLTLDGNDRTQLLQAINRLIASGPAKTPVRAATTANIATLAGGAPNTLDGVALAANDRILVKDQSTASQNGIYVVTTLGTGANGTWTRATDADGVGELLPGVLITVAEGTANADSIWELQTDAPITIGTTALTFGRKDAPVASTAEAQAFTDNTKIITALRLKEAFQAGNQSLATNGYQKLPGGLIIQWGTATVTAGTAMVVTLPIAFPTANVSAGVLGSAQSIGITTATAYYGINQAPTTTQISLIANTGSGSCRWLAIGY